MAWYHELHSAIASLFGRRAAERELNEEMRFHLEMESRRYEAEGATPAVARRLAARDFGGVERHKEDVRDERGARWMQDIGQDLRYGARSLRRRPTFTVIAALTLALGIGATTALFSVVKAVLLTPLPYRDPGSLVVLWSAWKGFDQTWLSYDEFEAYDTEIPAIANAALFTDGAVNLTDGGEPERIRAGFITEDMFDVLGVEPMLGRGFTKEEDRPNGPRVAALSHSLWQRRYGADPSILGREIQVDGQPTTVVGVMPAGFRLPLDFGGAGPTEVFIPIATDATLQNGVPGPAFNPNGQNHGFYGVALAALAVRLVRVAGPADLPRFSEARLDLPVLLFALGAAALTTLLAGVLPALQGSNGSPCVSRHLRSTIRMHPRSSRFTMS